MKINEITVSPEEFSRLSIEVKTTLIGLGHAMNELNLLHKLIICVPCNDAEMDRLVSIGRVNITKFAIWGILQRSKELWEYLKRTVYAGSDWLEILSGMTEDAKRSEAELKRYFGRKNRTDKLRNDFVSHFNYDKVHKLVSSAEPSMGFDIYFSDDTSNDFFKAADEIYHLASLNANTEEAMRKNLDGVLEDSRMIAKNLMCFGRGIVVSAMKKLSFKHRKLIIQNSPRLDQLRFEYFFEIPNTPEAQQTL